MCLTAYRPSCEKERITFYAYFNSDGGEEYSFSDNCTIENDKPVVEDVFSDAYVSMIEKNKEYKRSYYVIYLGMKIRS